MLSEVYFSRDLYMACLQLALSNEKEEVIGLLFGESKEEGGKAVAYISALMIPHRLDKKKDRVEISNQQLVAAADHAVELSQQFGTEIRVLGWYHSHPHITVWPSHVDVNTQAMYQMMDRNFVGVICSVFSEDKTTKECEINITCFQSRTACDGEAPQNVHVEVPLHIVPTRIPFYNCLQCISELPEILQKEEHDSYRMIDNNNLDILSKLHNELLLTKSLCHITDKITIPLLKTLEKRVQILKQVKHNVVNENKHLSKQIIHVNNTG